MGNIKKISCLLSIILCTACTPPAAEWTSIENAKQVKVEHVTITHTLTLPGNESGNKFNQAIRGLQDFLDDKVPYPNASTVIVSPDGKYHEKDIAIIKKILIKHGFSREYVALELETASEVDTPIKETKFEITVLTYYATPPSCSYWTRSLGDAQGANEPRDFGCAVRANLAMMVANPRDLIVGRTIGQADGGVHAAGVRRYREDKVKQIANISTTLGGSGNGDR